MTDPSTANTASGARTAEQHLDPCPGARARTPGRRCVLVVGHAAGPVLCGAERSLLDVLDGFAAIGMDTVVAVPPEAAGNLPYLAELTSRSTAVYLLDVPWRHLPTPADPTALSSFTSVITSTGVNAVAVNSIVVREPLLAARHCGVPAVVHAREIPPGAPGLCTLLGGSAEEVVASVLAEADWVVANSRATALTYPARARVSVVPCVVDPAAFSRCDPTGSPARAAIVGSVTAAKGVPEFLEVARRAVSLTDARFLVIGGEVEDLNELAGPAGIPTNVEQTGALPTPQMAMAHTDILVSASRATESFSRVVLEAMASGLPVVAFADGGPTELVVDGVSGYLVAPGDLDTLTERILALCADPALRRRMGEAGREIATSRFTPDDLAVALASSYRNILPSPEVTAARTDDVVVPLPTDNRSHFRDPFFVGNRARFATVTDVAFVDDTRLVAASLLGKRLYLLGLDSATGATTVLDEAPSIGAQGEVSVDLIDVDASGRVVTADCEASSVSLYDINADRIERLGTVSVTAAQDGYCHGAALVPGRRDVVAACITTGNLGVHLVTVDDGATVYHLTDGAWIPKSASFIDERTLVVAWVDGNIGQRPHDRYEARLTLVRLSRRWDGHRILARHQLPGRSLDGIHHRHGILLAAAQGDDAVLRFRIGRRSLRRMSDVVGFLMPHAADCSPSGDWLAVASYGDDAVVLRRLRPGR